MLKPRDRTMEIRKARFRRLADPVCYAGTDSDKHRRVSQGIEVGFAVHCPDAGMVGGCYGVLWVEESDRPVVNGFRLTGGVQDVRTQLAELLRDGA